MRLDIASESVIERKIGLTEHNTALDNDLSAVRLVCDPAVLGTETERLGLRINACGNVHRSLTVAAPRFARTASRAAAIVASGASFVPAALSSPPGETQISTAAFSASFVANTAHGRASIIAAIAAAVNLAAALILFILHLAYV